MKIRHDQAVDRFVTYLIGRRSFEQTTASRYRANCERWMIWLGQRRKNWGEATLDDCTEFFASIRDRYSSSYTANMLSALRHLYEWGMEEGYVPYNHWRKIDRPNVKTKRRPILSVEDMAEILAYNPRDDWYLNRNKALMLFLYSTGLRNKEASGCDVVDVDLRLKRVAINNGKRGANGYGPLIGPSADALKDYIDNVRPLRAAPREQALWVNRNGNRMDGVAIRRAVRRIEQETGVRVDVTPHGIRKSAGTHLYHGGADIHDVQIFLRHKKPETTQIYIDYTSERSKQVAEQYHPLNHIVDGLDEGHDEDREPTLAGHKSR